MANSQVDLNTNGTLTGSGLTKPGYLVIIAGQSNGTDRFTISGNLPAQNQSWQNDCYTYFKTVNDSNDNGSWVLMNPGVNTQTGTPQTGFFSIGVTMANRLKNNYNKLAYIVPTAIGGTYIANDITPSWNTSKTNEYYDRCYKDHVTKAILKIGGVQFTPVLVWIHGESDADTVAHGNAYQTNVTNLINKFRTDTGYPNMKVIITRLRSDYTGTNLGLSQVRTAQTNIVSSLNNVYLYDTETSRTPLSSDGQHYNPIVGSYGGTQSALNIGEDLADLIATF